eukprot:2342473-Rhodomonas_salina.1
MVVLRLRHNHRGLAALSVAAVFCLLAVALGLQSKGLLASLAEYRIPMVLDLVVCPPRQQLGDRHPPRAHRLDRLNDGEVLFLAPWLALDVRIQLVPIPLSTLLCAAVWKDCLHIRPVLRAMLRYQFQDPIVLL